MNIAICDDNIIQLNFITNFIMDYTKQYDDTTITSYTPFALLEKLRSKEFSFDLVITDIDLGSLNGIELAQQINIINPRCKIIFISYNINFATSIFDANHIYFVLKSELEDRLPKAIDKAYLLYKDIAYKYLTAKYQGNQFTIPIADILYIDAIGRYLYIHEQMNTYKYIGTLKVVTDGLPTFFVKCHKSYLVNLNYIQAITQSTCILKNNVQIPISQTYNKNFKKQYLNYIASSL